MAQCVFCGLHFTDNTAVRMSICKTCRALDNERRSRARRAATSPKKTKRVVPKKQPAVSESTPDAMAKSVWEWLKEPGV